MGFVSPDLEAAGFVSPDLLGAVSVVGWGYIYLFFSSPTAIYDLSDRWGLGGIYTFPLPPNGNLLSSSSLQHVQNRAGALSLSHSIIDLKTPSKSIDFPIILEGKGSKTRLESSSIDSPTLKSTWFMFWLAIVFVTLGAWLLAG